jgi:hypothetical protein
LKETGLVDLRNNNVICVVTHSLSLSTDQYEFIEKMEKKKAALTKVLLEHLETNVPVAFIENNIKNLEKCDDWTLLPG